MTDVSAVLSTSIIRETSARQHSVVSQKTGVFIKCMNGTDTKFDVNPSVMFLVVPVIDVKCIYSYWKIGC